MSSFQTGQYATKGLYANLKKQIEQDLIVVSKASLTARMKLLPNST